MAITYASLSAADRAFAAADKPIFLARNWMRVDSVLTSWRQGGSWIAGSDESDADGAALYGRDDQSYRKTYPATSQTTWYYLVDLVTSTRVLDAAAILSHGNLTGVQVDLQVADDSAFTTNLRTISTITPTDTTRIVFLDLDEAVGVEQQYSSVRYVRLKFTKGTGFIPEFGELILSERLQSPYKSEIPYDISNLRTNESVFESDSGVISTYCKWKKRKVLNLTFLLDESTYIDDLVSMWEDDLDGGRYPFLYIENPGTAPTDAHWMKEQEPELTGPYHGPVARVFAMSSIEHGPHFLKNE